MVKVNRNKSFEEGLKDYLKTCNKDTVEANSIKYLLEYYAPAPFLEIKINGKIIFSIKRNK